MSENKTDLSKYVVNVQGKDFITFPGLLAEAHSQGLVGIETNLVNPESKDAPIVKAIITLRGEGPQNFKVFTGYGDATKTNVASKVAGALLRMAETRAIARALRFACNIDMTAIEELDSENENVTSVKATPTNTNSRFNKPQVAPAVPKVESKTPEVTQKQETSTPVVAKPSFSRKTTVKSEPNFP